MVGERLGGGVHRRPGNGRLRHRGTSRSGFGCTTSQSCLGTWRFRPSSDASRPRALGTDSGPAACACRGMRDLNGKVFFILAEGQGTIFSALLPVALQPDGRRWRGPAAGEVKSPTPGIRYRMRQGRRSRVCRARGLSRGTRALLYLSGDALKFSFVKRLT